jgi:hypothetical protein
MYIKAVFKEFHTSRRSVTAHNTWIVVTFLTRVLVVPDSALLRGSHNSRFHQSLHENDALILRLVHDRFLPIPFQFIIHVPPYHSALHNVATDSVPEQPATK